MKTMRFITHSDDPKIKEGLACIFMDDNGWIGTSNGWPFVGIPALFPAEQAEAICYAWNFLKSKGVKVFPHDTPNEEIKLFPGLALFDAFPIAEKTLALMNATVHKPNNLERKNK